jgi:hypothetical protein
MSYIHSFFNTLIIRQISVRQLINRVSFLVTAAGTILLGAAADTTQ